MQPLDVLRTCFHLEHFRGIQKEIIDSVLSRKDTLGLMPTGGGKSLTFQVPALCMEGLCLVITPLVALMRDQVEKLRQRGILAQMIDASMSAQQIETALRNCVYGPYKFLYVSPERLSSDTFLRYLSHLKVSLLTVDESHCISLWGHDFRPSYLKIADLRDMLKGVPVLALTATATPRVQDEIQEKLLFKEKNVIRMSFLRENLAYSVEKTHDRLESLFRLLESCPGSAIVYTRSRLKCPMICSEIESRGISATFYHAGLDPILKERAQNAWQASEKRVMVATNAFGMGIDKSDVRLVVHFDIPDSLEAYFQEAGRAGRDGGPSRAVLLYDASTAAAVLERTAVAFPPQERIRDIYESLQYYMQMPLGDGMGSRHLLDMETFCRNFRYFPQMVESALRILEQSGYLEYKKEEGSRSRLMMTVKRDDLYQMTLSESQEVLIRLLLRNYTGLFTQYATISETLLSVRSGMDRQMVYGTLRQLHERGVVSYVPTGQKAYVTYLMPRVEKEQIQFTDKVYLTRRKAMEESIGAMLGYARSDDVCRSRLLLRHLGEEAAKDCQKCDVCLNRSES